MNIIILLIVASFTIASCFLLAFIWAVRNGQYDDQYTPSVRILFDDPPFNPPLLRMGEKDDTEEKKIKNNTKGQTEESKYDQ